MCSQGNKTQFVDDIAQLTFFDDNLIRIEIFDNTKFVLDHAIRLLQIRLENNKKHKHLLLCPVGKNVAAKKDARDFSGGVTTKKFTTAIAVLHQSIITKNLMNFFVHVSKPLVPVRFFSSEEDAKKWLLSFTPELIEDRDVYDFFDEFS